MTRNLCVALLVLLLGACGGSGGKRTAQSESITQRSNRQSQQSHTSLYTTQGFSAAPVAFAAALPSAHTPTLDAPSTLSCLLGMTAAGWISLRRQQKRIHR